MRVRLLKATENSGDRKLHRGQVYTVTNDKAKKLIKEGIAEEYKGEMPPATKATTDLFNPKKDNK